MPDAPHEDPTSKTLDELRREIDELRASRVRLVLAADADRRRIERDLHDGLQQHLVAVAVDLQLVEASMDSDPASARTHLEELGRDLGLVLDEAAQLAERIYPPRLGTRDLAAALRAAAANAGIPVHVCVTAHASYAPEVLTTVHWCFLEVLDQAGAATKAAVTVRDDAEGVAFEIVTDGSRPDVGLDGLRDRVEALGGRFTIDPEPGAGVVRLAGSLPRPRG